MCKVFLEEENEFRESVWDSGRYVNDPRDVTFGATTVRLCTSELEFASWKISIRPINVTNLGKGFLENEKEFEKSV